MNDRYFIIPGLGGSGPDHWQTWLESRLPGCERLQQVDWGVPHLDDWVGQATRQLTGSGSRQWLVAHSFGCLVAAMVAVENPGLVAGLVLVAPADPRRFSAQGEVLPARVAALPDRPCSVADLLPHALPRTLPSVLIASTDDPWFDLEEARTMASLWHCRFLELGAAGHINAASGHGPWPGLLHQLGQLGTHAEPDLGQMTAAVLSRPAGGLASTGRACLEDPEPSRHALRVEP